MFRVSDAGRLRDSPAYSAAGVRGGVLDNGLQWWLVAAAASAGFGASLGTNYLTPSFLRYLLSALLLTGGLWMLWAW